MSRGRAQRDGNCYDDVVQLMGRVGVPKHADAEAGARINVVLRRQVPGIAVHWEMQLSLTAAGAMSASCVQPAAACTTR